MSQTERIYYILRKLSAGEKLTSKEVATRYEISERQFRRDIEYLKDRMNYAISYDSKNKTYILENRDKEEDYSEYRYLIMESLVDSLLGRLPLGEILSKDIKSLLSESMSKETRSVLDKIVYHAPKIDLPKYDTFSIIVDSLVKDSLLKINYINRTQWKSERVVEPLKLINYDSVWYLVAYDHMYSNLRTFHLSRIQKAVISNGERIFSDKKELSEYIDAGCGIFLAGNLEPYVMRFKDNAAFQIQTEMWHEKQSIKLLDNGEVELTVPAKQPYELAGRLLSFGGDGYPVSPEGFVSYFNKCVEKLKKINS